MEYKVITIDRYEEVIQHLRDSFFADEPLNKAAGLCQKGCGHYELEQHSYETLKDNLSIVAVSEHNEIAGVALNGILERGHLESSNKKLECSSDENFKKIFRLLNQQNAEGNIFNKFNIDKAFDLRILSVDARFRGQGIAKELVIRSEKIAKDFGFELMKADATGIFSQKILKSNGFQVLNEIYYNKYVDEFGNQILNVDPPHIKLQLLYKLLKY